MDSTRGPATAPARHLRGRAWTDFQADETPVPPEPGPTARATAARVVAAHATGPDDLADLLTILGLGT
jgi:hypothetical protein